MHCYVASLVDRPHVDPSRSFNPEIKMRLTTLTLSHLNRCSTKSQSSHRLETWTCWNWTCWKFWLRQLYVNNTHTLKNRFYSRSTFCFSRSPVSWNLSSAPGDEPRVHVEYCGCWGPGAEEARKFPRVGGRQEPRYSRSPAPFVFIFWIWRQRPFIWCDVIQTFTAEFLTLHILRQHYVQIENSHMCMTHVWPTRPWPDGLLLAPASMHDEMYIRDADITEVSMMPPI